MLFVLTVFNGCSCKSVPFVSCDVQYVDRNVTVNIPVRCNVPTTFCSEEGSLHEGTIVELLKCIVELREASTVCQSVTKPW